MTGEHPAPRRDPFEAEYWAHAAQGSLCLQACEACAAFRYPPAPICPECGSEAASWKPLSGRGRIVAWTIFHRSYFPALPAPYTVVSVETEEGPLLVGNLLDSDGPPRIGAPVRAVLVPVRFTDSTTGRLCQWRPVSLSPHSPEGELP